MDDPIGVIGYVIGRLIGLAIIILIGYFIYKKVIKKKDTKTTVKQ